MANTENTREDGLLAETEALRRANSRLKRLVSGPLAEYRTLADASGEAMAVVDREHRYRAVNREFLQQWGLGRSQVIGRKVSAFLDEAIYQVRVKPLLDRAFQGEEVEYPLTMEYPGIGRRSLIVRYKPVGSAPGPVSRVAAVIRDVTEREEAENRYRDLFVSMLDGFALHEIILDAAGRPRDYRFLAVNPAFERLTGLRAEDLIGKTVLEVLPNTEPHWIETYGRTALTGETVRFEHFSREIGRHFRVTAYRPAPGRFACVFADVTGARQAREAQRLWAEIFERADWGITVAAPDGSVFDRVNPAFARMHGVEARELIGAPIESLYAPHERTRLAEMGQRLLEKGHISFEADHLRRDGSTFPARVDVTLVTDENGKPLYRAANVLDVSDRRLVEEELIRSREAAEAANRAKSEFLATMSHEIRTPLNGVMGMLQLLQTTKLTGEQAEFVDVSLTSSKNLLRLLSDILDISRIESGRFELSREPFSLREVLAPVIEAFARQAREKGVELEAVLDPETPPTVLGDPLRVRQTLFNLVGNAVKFTEKGRVRVEIRPLPEGGGPNRVVAHCCVSDTGMGIPDDKIDMIFESFTQADGSYVRRFGGAGLGLSIVRRLISMMGGSLAVESEPGKGTAFHFSLPLGLIPDQAVPEASPEAPPPALKGESPWVLVVEDDAVNRLSAVRMVEKLGYRAAGAADGLEALAALDERAYDCVLMDVQMPRLDGVAAARRIRGRGDARAATPVVAMTAYAMTGDRERFLEAGMDDYLAKPVSMADLKQALSRVLGRPDATDAP